MFRVIVPVFLSLYTIHFFCSAMQAEQAQIRSDSEAIVRQIKALYR
jgi:hypothetical protein